MKNTKSFTISKVSDPIWDKVYTLSLRLNKYPSRKGGYKQEEKIIVTKCYFCDNYVFWKKDWMKIRKWSLINEMSRVEDIGSFNNYLVHNFRKLKMETGSALLLFNWICFFSYPLVSLIVFANSIGLISLNIRFTKLD